MDEETSSQEEVIPATITFHTHSTIKKFPDSVIWYIILTILKIQLTKFIET